MEWCRTGKLYLQIQNIELSTYNMNVFLVKGLMPMNLLAGSFIRAYQSPNERSCTTNLLALNTLLEKVK